MISYTRALEHVLSHPIELESQRVPIELSYNRILAEAVVADRDLPPYDRATMDGIAIDYKAYHAGNRIFPIEGMARAGAPQASLKNPEGCLEITTGAVLPEGADTVVRYEDLSGSDGSFSIEREVRQGQNIHRKGSDAPLGRVLLEPGTRIGAAEISVMASMGCDKPLLMGLPAVTLVSSGDELVNISETPKPHQIRKSNIHTLEAELTRIGITPETIHLRDDPEQIRRSLRAALVRSNVLMLSGGVSKGRYDFIPEALEALGVRKIFHRVAQRPGKPFWFGHQPELGCWVFSFPGNPVSTFLNYHLYFREWLRVSQGLAREVRYAILSEELVNKSDLTHFRPVRLDLEEGKLTATPISMNGSGDFLSLTLADAFIRLEPGSQAEPGEVCEMIPFNPLWQ